MRIKTKDIQHIKAQTGTPRYPFLWGVGTLGNLAGGYATFEQLHLGKPSSRQSSDLAALRNDMRKLSRNMRQTFSQMTV